MIDLIVTIVGNVVTEPRMSLTKTNAPFTTFRFASTPRRFDRASGEWRDGDTLFASVTCWRGLAENVATCVKKGQSVIVHGRLSVRPYETPDGAKRESVDIDAQAIGPDLSRAVATVRRAERSLGVVPDLPATEFTTNPAAAGFGVDDRASDDELYPPDVLDGSADIGSIDWTGIDAGAPLEGSAAADDLGNAVPELTGPELAGTELTGSELAGGQGGRFKKRSSAA